MVLESLKCLICGKSFDSIPKSVFPEKDSYIFEAWKSECARATCEVLLGENSDYFASYFQNANYCISCENLVRDVCFTWKQIQSFQNRLENLSTKIVERLDSNYEKIKDKSHMTIVQENVSLILGTDVVPVKIPEYSYEEMIEIIYSVSFRAQLNNFPIRCWNLNSSFFNHPKLHHVEGNSIPDSDVIPASPSVRIKEEELSENENCFQKRSLDYSTEENQAQIKTERHDSSQEKANEKFVPAKFEEDLSDDNYNECQSSSGSDYDVKKKKRRTWIHQSGSKRGKPQKLLKKTRGKYRCTEENCDKICIAERSLQVHILKEHKVVRNYKCDLCPKRYGIERQLIRHVEDVHYNKKNLLPKFCCTEENCKKRCISEENLNIHIQKVHKGEKKPYKCEKCQKRFTLQPHLVRHMKEIHDKGKRMRSIDCSYCGKMYPSTEDLALHYSNSHQEPNPFQCAFCPEIYETTNDLKKHTKDVHCEVFKCRICAETFLTIWKLRHHEKRNHKYASFDCKLCGTLLPSLETYRAHKCTNKEEKSDSHKTERKKSDAPKKVKENSDAVKKEKKKLADRKYMRKIKRRPIFRYNFECKFCCKGYNEEQEMNLHYTEAHQGPNPFTCAFCPEIYSNSVDLQKHMESIHPDPNIIAGKLKCETCDRYFVTKLTLRLHSLSHVDPNLLLKCHLCPSVFKQRYSLNKHIEGHSGERKYICETCGKRYKSSDGLYRHSITHDESRRKWKCKICDKKFFTRGHCMNHERIHINMKEFVCEICGKGFNMEVNMTQHMKIHKGLPTRRPRPKTQS